MNITFTPAASHYLKTKIEKERGIGFRLSIKKTGCSGFAYLPEIVAEIPADHVSLVIENGITIFVDSKWQTLLADINVDYVEEMKSGLKQKRLVFSNPNETNRCGCGESFHVE